MGTRKRRTVLLSKWTKTNALLDNPYIRPFMLDTRKYNKSNLKTMLDAYKMVYVKPEVGTHGDGVIRVEQLDSGRYSYQLNTTKVTAPTLEALHRSMSTSIKKKKYLIQRGIYLKKYNKQRFDIRVMVQYSTQGVWETTGIIGRVAKKGRIVTNYHVGGKLVEIKRLLGAHLSPSETENMIQKLGRLGVTTAQHLHRKYPGIRQIGLDIGLDRAWIPWVIEVNTNPNPYIFNKLADKSIYKKIMKYRKAAGIK